MLCDTPFVCMKPTGSWLCRRRTAGIGATLEGIVRGVALAKHAAGPSVRSDQWICPGLEHVCVSLVSNDVLIFVRGGAGGTRFLNFNVFRPTEKSFFAGNPLDSWEHVLGLQVRTKMVLSYLDTNFSWVNRKNELGRLTRSELHPLSHVDKAHNTHQSDS